MVECGKDAVREGIGVGVEFGLHGLGAGVGTYLLMDSKLGSWSTNVHGGGERHGQYAAWPSRFGRWGECDQ